MHAANAKLPGCQAAIIAPQRKTALRSGAPMPLDRPPGQGSVSGRPQVSNPSFEPPSGLLRGPVAAREPGTRLQLTGERARHGDAAAAGAAGAASAAHVRHVLSTPHERLANRQALLPG